jgi:hypothetical protein
LDRIGKTLFGDSEVAYCVRVETHAKHIMSNNTEPSEDGRERQRTQMPDFQLNHDSEPHPDAAEPTDTDGDYSASRRRFMAASAVAGLGAAGMTGAVSADEDDDMDDDTDDHDDNGDMDADARAVEVDLGAGFTVQDIVDNPSGFFVDVHTTEFLPGAIRGQIEGEPGNTNFVVQADGEQVVDGDTGEVGVGDPDGSGLYELDLQPEDNTICFSIAVDVTPPYESPANTSTHIHEAPVGEAGPPRIVFPDPKPNDPDTQQVRTSVGCLPGEFATMTGLTGPVDENPRVDADDVEEKHHYTDMDDHDDC